MHANRRRNGVGLTTACLLFSMAATPAARAQTVGFDPADYGRAQLPLRQTTGDAAAYVDQNKGAFEPIAELDPKDPLAVLARPIGRVDILLKNTRTGQQMGASCTGTLLPGDYVLTNHHCLPQSGDLTPVKASVLMDYLTLDGKGSRRFEMDARPVEFDPRLDYALARVAGHPGEIYGTARLSGAAITGNPSMLVVHHPLGRPKVMSRFRCFAMKDQPDGPDLHHRCDTLAGSSGSLMFDGPVGAVALHKEGGLDPKDTSSFNSATRLSAILGKSRILAEIAAHQGRPVATADPGKPPAAPAAAAPAGPPASAPLDPAGMNAILRGR
ncbi:trypsin-like peptidase domain-containing protein [Methylobacterium sp. C25]|uniref:trypsin-like serine peptidase n=1 Tax=Methylobacterium sp. C25 TaxID=2721622 RepID=UPI001F36E6E7|nr:serine protease [Methylobacterium sp. C25]MCE4226108.1 trypsin-like peptidase domain-containing protein [Methylobacterium sp. C25]